MKQIFISQPMNGKTNEEINQERQQIIDNLTDKYGFDIEIIDSFFEGAPHDANPVWFLGKSIQCLARADVAVFAPKWAFARGCVIEHEVAKKYGIEVIEYDE